MTSKRNIRAKAEGTKRQKRNQQSLQEKKESIILSGNEITELGEEVISGNYNNLVLLMKQYDQVKGILLREKNDEVEVRGRLLTVTLYKSYQRLIKERAFAGNKNSKEDDTTTLVKRWLSNKYETFKATMNDIIKQKFKKATSLQIDMVEIMLALIKLEAKYMKGSAEDSYFPSLTFRELTIAVLENHNGTISSDGVSDNVIVSVFNDKFKRNWDLQFYFYHNLHDTLTYWKSVKSKEELKNIVANFYSILDNRLLFQEDVEALRRTDTWIELKVPSIAYKPSCFKNDYQKAIICILSYPLLVSQYKSVLLILHKRIIPYMAQPQNLMDFLTDAYNTDDVVICILALNALYELMKTFNLEYPDFYSKLYSLLTPELLQTRHRSRFFRLCDLFLSSTHLAASLVASFIKKLARLSLTSSASGIVIVIPFIYNLLKRHPSCMVMLHNPQAATNTSYVDPYNNEEPDPLKTGALGSSLWELETLMSHYHPNIATLARIFKEPFRKHHYNMEDFLDWSYASLLESENTRRYRDRVALEFEKWDRLLEDSSFANNSVTSSTYMSGWSL